MGYAASIKVLFDKIEFFFLLLECYGVEKSPTAVGTPLSPSQSSCFCHPKA